MNPIDELKELVGGNLDARFRFHDGEKNRVADPFLVMMRLQAAGWENLDKTALSTDAIERMTDAAYKIFDLKRPAVEADGTESGTTALRAMKIVLDFIEWQDELKNSPGSIPTLQQPMEPKFSTSPLPSNSVVGLIKTGL